ncbi:MAG: hypothetical protein IKE30_05865 [Clostridia bacterium]|nr:hypothetical protein [Clostridia bacterium]
MNGRARTWASVCGSCAYYGKTGCAFPEATGGPDDCIAAVCGGFAPADGRGSPGGAGDARSAPPAPAQARQRS